jgi:hypothetical protein
MYSLSERLAVAGGGGGANGYGQAVGGNGGYPIGGTGQNAFNGYPGGGGGTQLTGGTGSSVGSLFYGGDGSSIGNSLVGGGGGGYYGGGASLYGSGGGGSSYCSSTVVSYSVSSQLSANDRQNILDQFNAQIQLLGIDAQRQASQFAYQEPYQRLSVLGSGITGLLAGQPQAPYSQQVTPLGAGQQASPLSQALSSAATVYGLGSIFGGK